MSDASHIEVGNQGVGSRGFVPEGASTVWANLSEVQQSVAVVLGRTEEAIGTVLNWSEGSLIEVDKQSGDAVEVLVNGKLCARGEVVTVAENFGVRITEIVTEK